MRVFQKWFVFVLIAGTLFMSQCSIVPQRPVRLEPVARWEPIVFKLMDKAVELSRMERLRDKRLGTNEYEVRIWRGFGLGDLEMVVFHNIRGGWSGRHVIANDYVDITQTQVAELAPPKLGWDRFGDKLSELGIFSLETSYDETCWSGLDGTSHIVEISKGGSYRVYLYRSNMSDCNGSRIMDIIAEFIAIQFDDGTKECELTEWFPCGKVIQKHRLQDELESK